MTQLESKNYIMGTINLNAVNPSLDSKVTGCPGMVQEHYGLQNNHKATSIFPRSSLRLIRNNVVSRRTSYSRQGLCWRVRRVLLKLLIVQTCFTNCKVYGFPLKSYKSYLDASPEIQIPGGELNQNFVTDHSILRGFRHPLITGYRTDQIEEDAIEPRLISQINDGDVPVQQESPESQENLPLASALMFVHRLYENDKSDWLMKKKKEEQYNPQLVDFEGQLFGKIALNDIEKQNDMALGLMKKQKRRFHRAIPIRNIQLNHFLRSSVPSKRILFNEIVLNHAPDLRKNDSLLQEPKKLTATASDKASRYFADLQHLRKKFWERYRHLLIPMIRTRIENSGGKRLTRTATSHGLRQTKRSGVSTRSAANFGNKRLLWFPGPNGFRYPRHGIRLYRLYKKSDTGPIKMDDPNGAYPFERLLRMGRSPTKTISEGMAQTFKNRKLPQNMNKANPSIMHYLAYSLLKNGFDEKRNRRSSKREEVPMSVIAEGDESFDPFPVAFEGRSFPSKPATEDDQMEDVYFQLLNEILKEKALTNRRSNQSKLRLL